MVVEIGLCPCENSGTNICSDRKPCDLEYADNVVLLSEDLMKLQVILDRLNDSTGMFGIRFAPSKCKLLL